MSKELYENLFKAISQEGEVMLRLQNSAEHSEPMYAHVDSDRDLSLWFFMDKSNRVAGGGLASVQFVSKDHKLFGSILGRLVEEKDSSLVEQFWSNPTAAWFEGGIDDPSVHLMRLDLQSAEIWTKSPNLTGAFKLMSGSKVDPEDVGDHALVDIK